MKRLYKFGVKTVFFQKKYLNEENLSRAQDVNITSFLLPW